MHAIVWYLAATFCLGPRVQPLDGPSLTVREAQLLVTSVPDALAVKRRGGCPSADYSELSADLALVQLRNRCLRSGSGMIGNYVVDLHTGRIWSDIDRTREVDSPRLRKLRREILARLRHGGGQKGGERQHHDK